MTNHGDPFVYPDAKAACKAIVAEAKQKQEELNMVVDLSEDQDTQESDTAQEMEVEISQKDHDQLGKFCVDTATTLKPFAKKYGAEFVKLLVVTCTEQFQEPEASTPKPARTYSTVGDLQKLLENTTNAAFTTPRKTKEAGTRGESSSTKRGRGASSAEKVERVTKKARRNRSTDK